MLILASASPRRIELLRLAGYEPRVLPSRVPESRRPGEAPKAMVQRLALAKALEVAKRLKGRAPASLRILAADTTVALGKQVLEKPRDAKHAHKMLTALSGKAHWVHTGVALVEPGSGRKPQAFVESTKVIFRQLSRQEIQAYVETGEPLDKAGAYGIQAGAAGFVARIEGDYNNVVGLPLARVMEILG